MKRHTLFAAAAFAAFIGIGVFLTTGFAQEKHYGDRHYGYSPDLSSCVCSAPLDLTTRANRSVGRTSSLRSELEPKFLMSLYNCQCGPLYCAVSAQSISCRK